MSLRIGLALDTGAVRAVAVRGNHIVWAAEMLRERARPLQATVELLLESVPRSRWLRPILSAAVGPHGSQVKLLNGIPEVQDAAMLDAIIREGVGTFFLKADSPLLTTGVRPIGFRSAIAAAIETDAVVAIRAACLTARFRLGRIAPTAVVLPLALENEVIGWRDGDIAMEIHHSGGVLESVRTRPLDPEHLSSMESAPVRELAALGAQAVTFADAYGAAIVDLRETLALDPAAAGWLGEAARRRRRRRLAAVAGLGIASLLLSPLAATWAKRQADTRASAVRPDQWQVIVSSLEQLDRVTAALDELRKVTATRSSTLLQLGALTGVLPDGSVLLSLDITGNHIQFVAMARNPTELLSAVRTLPGSQSAEIVGGLNRETVGGADMQRVTIQFGSAKPAVALVEGGPR